MTKRYKEGYMQYIKHIWVWKLGGRGEKRITNQKYIKKTRKVNGTNPNNLIW